MSKYTTGHYKITLFDERGTKIGQYSLGDIGIISAVEHGREQVAEGKCHSFSVDRNVFNSLNTPERWMP